MSTATIDESRPTEAECEQEEADRVGMTIDQYRLQEWFNAELEQGEILLTMSSGDYPELSNVKDYERSVRGQQLTFLMANGDQYYIDTRVHKVEKGSKRDRKRARRPTKEEEDEDDLCEEGCECADCGGNQCCNCVFPACDRQSTD